MREKYIVTGVPNIDIYSKEGSLIDNMFTIDTVISYDDSYDTIEIVCAELPREFKRGFVCDITPKFLSRNINTHDLNEDCYMDEFCNCVLVYVYKEAEVNELPRFRYVFYK